MATEVVVVDQFGVPYGEAIDATVSEVVWELNGIGTASITIPTNTFGARLIALNKREVQIFVDGELWWGVPRRKRGNQLELTFELEGIMSHLLRRFVLTATLMYTSVDQLQIGWNLVAAAQTGTNRDRNIDSAVFLPSGHNRSRIYSREEHPNILTSLQEFPTLEDGFDFDIVVFEDGRREWTPYYPRKGERRDELVLEWGRNVVNFEYAEDGSNQASLIYQVGGSANDVRFEAKYEDVDTAEEYGSMEDIVSAGDEKDVDWLAEKAKQAVQDRHGPQILPELICTNEPVQLFGVVKTGDILPVDVDINDGAVFMVGDFRVTKIRWLPNGHVGLSFLPELIELPDAPGDVTEAPAAPTGLTATAQSNRLISLQWTALTRVTAYRIYRWNGTTFAFLFEIPAPSRGSTISTFDSPLTAGTLYRYKVSAVNSIGEGALSAEASATTAGGGGAPTGLSTTVLSNTSYNLTWNRVTGASGYKIYRWNGIAWLYKRTVADPGSGSTVTALEQFLNPGTTYKNKVSAIVGGYEGDLSAEAEAVLGGVRETVKSTGTYTNWFWPDVPGNGAFNLDSVMKPMYNQFPAGYFWSHQFGFKHQGGGYIGLQTHSGPFASGNGPGGIMSIWDALDAVAGDPVNGYGGTFGGEGEGYSVRVPYNWIPGRAYRMRLWVDDPPPGKTNDLGIWWGGWIIDEVTGAETLIGHIQVPAAWGYIGNFSIEWTEYYSPDPPTCADIPYSDVIFSVPTQNAGTVLPNSREHHLSTIGTCPNSSITDLGSLGARQEMGIPVPEGGSGLILDHAELGRLDSGRLN